MNIAVSRDQTLLRAYGLAAFAVILWGATPAATKVAVSGMDASLAALLRTVFAAGVTLPVVLLFRMPLPQGKRDWGLLLLSAAAGFGGFTILFSLGVARTSASHAALINAAIPLFVGFFGAVAEGQRPGRYWIAGVAVAIIGEIVLISERGGGGAVTLFGDLLCVGSSALAGLGYVAGSRLAIRLGTFSVTFWGIAIAGVIQAPLAWWLWSNGSGSIGIAEDAWTAVLYLAFASSILGYLAWYKALADGGVVRMAPMQFAMPVISLALATAWLGDAVTPSLIFACVMVLSGIALSRRR